MLKRVFLLITLTAVTMNALLVGCSGTAPMERLKKEDPARFEYEQKANAIYKDLMEKIDEVITVYHDPAVLYQDKAALAEAREVIRKHRAEAISQRKQAWKEYKEKSLPK